MKWLINIRRRISDALKSARLNRSLKSSHARQRALAQFGLHADSVLVRTHEGAFLVDPSDLKIAKSLLDTALLNQREIDLLKMLRRAGSSLLVVGGHYGTVAIPAARVFEQVTVVEANPRTAQLLRDNVNLNAMSAKIHVIEGAAAEKNEQISFLTNQVNSGGSKRMPRILQSIYAFDAATLQVPGLVLDEHVQGEPDVIFMDIEGSEVFALRGMQRLVAKARYVSMEFMPHLIKNVAGISVDELVAQIPPRFDTLFFLKTGHVSRGRNACVDALIAAFERNENHDHVIWFSSDNDQAGLLEVSS